MTKMDRRAFSLSAFGSGVLLGGLSSQVQAQDASPEDALVIPPPDAIMKTTACNYCIVGCGYRTFAWPVGESGGTKANENALAKEFTGNIPFEGDYPWPSPQMHNIVQIDGQPHHLIIQPDPETEYVNPRGDHTLGGSLARKLYSTETGTGRDRFLTPKIRVGDTLYDITWDEALTLVARMSAYVLENYGRSAWGLKSYSYQFYENTYAITKLALGAIGTPCWAPHDQPGDGSSTPGLSDAGINAFSATYREWSQADTIFMSGVAAYDARGVLFSNWVSPAGGDKRPNADKFDFGDADWVASTGSATTSRRLIVVNPRRDMTAEIAERHGGVHLQLNPGTDSVLQNAIARVIIEEGWEDADFIAEHVGGMAELDMETSWRRTHHAVTYDAYRRFILDHPAHTLAEAERITGVPESKIRKAAELMARPLNGRRPKTSLMLEKGNYWNHNYVNTASFASLGLLVGAGHRPGQVVSRGGGHQRGMVSGGRYPSARSAYHEETTGQNNKIGHNLDDWIMRGNLRLAWAIGCTWAGGGTAAASALYGKMRAATREHSIQPAMQDVFPQGPSGGLDVDAAFDAFRRRIDSRDAQDQPDGMFFIQQDLYSQDLTELADIVLSPSSWGEEDFTRMQGERRLRLYSKLVDAPGDTRPDWWIVAQVAQRLAELDPAPRPEDPEAYDFSGFEWQNSNQIFEEAAPSGGASGYRALVDRAQALGKTGHELLAERGTRGYQCPLVLGADGEIEETERNYQATKDGNSRYGTQSNKALFVIGDWDVARPNQDSWKPRADELWVVNRRTSVNWSSVVEDARNPYRVELAGDNFLEMHPEDAAALGIADGDAIVVETEDAQDSSVVHSFEAVARVLEPQGIRRGVTCTYFNYFGEVQHAANNVVPNKTDPNGMMYPFKLGRGRVRKAIR